MKEKSNDELLKIWNDNDREQYSADAFVAIQLIFKERGIVFSNQKLYNQKRKSKRISRTKFLLQYLVIIFLGSIFSAILKNTTQLWLIVLIVLIILLFVLSLVIDRLHDFDKSGWWCLLVFVPLVNFIFIFFLFFIPGNKGTNRYGPNPRLK